MLMYLTYIEDAVLHAKVRRWLTETYGCSARECVNTLTEVQSLCALHPEIRAIITDLPAGKPLQFRYDELRTFAHEAVQIVFIRSGDERITIPGGGRSFTVVPEQRLGPELKRALHTH